MDTVGRYRLRERLGAGASGVVYAAYDPQLGRQIALKLLDPSVDDARLRSEARAMAQISDPAVVHVYEVDRHDDRPFIAMELIDGVTLRTWLEQERPRWKACLDAMLAIGRGLAAAHDAAVVHGDVKPDNVLVARTGRVCVGDFGLAAIDSARTVVGGTPAYMAPEQHTGRVASFATDQFSYAVTCWEMLYRERPFANDSTEVSPSLAVATEIIAGRRRSPPAGASIPKFVRVILERALATDPVARWPSMRAMLLALNAGIRRRQRRTGLLIACGVAGVAASIAVGATVWAYARPSACEVASASVARVWSPEIARQLADRFARTKRPEAAHLALAAGQKLDRWTATWSSVRSATCDAEVSEVERERRVRCLDRKIEVLRARLAVFDDASGAVVDRALEIADLPDPAACAMPERPMVLVEPPRDVLANLEREHEVIHAELLAGRFDGLLARARTAAGAAVSARYAPAIADAEDLVASIAYYSSEQETGESAARRAIAAAVESRDDVRIVLSWSHLVSMAAGARRTGALEEGILAMRAALTRVDDPSVEIDALSTIGVAEHRLGRSDAAIATCKQALARGEKELGPDAMPYNQARRCLQLVYYEVGRITDGLPLAEARSRWCERYYGVNHPFTAEALMQEAELLGYLGRTSASITLQRRVLEIYARVLGMESMEVAKARTALGEALLYSKEYKAETIELFEQAIVTLERLAPDSIFLAGAYGSLAYCYGLEKLDTAIALHRKSIEAHGRLPQQMRDKQVAIARSNFAELLLDAKRYTEAVVEYEQAIIGLEHVPDLAPWWVGGPLTGLGECQSKLGRISEAITTLERAHALLASPDAQATLRVHNTVKLAELRWSSRHDRARAIALLEAACEMFTALEQTTNVTECKGQVVQWRKEAR